MLAGLIIAGIAVGVAYGVGYWQGRSAQKALDLSITKAIPKLGSDVKINKRQENSRAFPPFYYLVATIYNEGELPAKQLHGHCKLFSPENESQQRNIPINRDFLGSAPFELEAGRLDALFIDPDRPSDARFDVDIEFEYFGIPDDKPQRYTAKYRYDNKSGQMNKIK
jgi:hypothetical protein